MTSVCMASLRRLVALAGLLVVALGSLVMISATSAFACSCVRADAAQHAHAASEVFVGTITETERSGGGLAGRGRSVDWTVAVDRIWKGAVPSTVTVSSSTQSTACGLGDLPEARPVIFFVGPDGAGADGARSVNSCGGTSVLQADVEKEVTAALGPPYAPSAGTTAPSAGDDPSSSEEHQPLLPVWSEIVLGLAVLVGGLGLVAGAVAAAFWLRRRR